MLGETNSNKNYLLFDKYFAEGEICCIAADPGVGKTYLACHIAKHPSITKNAYFELDDGYNQKERFKQIPSIYPIYRPIFEQAKNKLHKKASDMCFDRAINETFNKFPEMVESKKIKYMKQLGIISSNKVDELQLFAKFVQEGINNGVNLITLDTLSSLVDCPWEITRKCVETISRACKQKGISFLILQHTTKQGCYSGTSGLLQIVDTFLYLKDLGGNLRKLIVEKARYEKNKEDLYLQMISEGEHSVRFEICEIPKEPLKQKLSPYEEKILNVLGDNETIELYELSDALGVPNKTSLKNTLLTLEKKGYLKRLDGKAWTTISNCRKER